VRRAENLLRRADGWVFAREDARRLAAVRIGLCSLLALRLATTDYGFVAGQRAARVQPLSYLNLFERMSSPEVVTVLQVCGIVAALLAAAGLALRASLPLAVACSLALNGMFQTTLPVRFYNDVVLTLCLLVLIACGAAASEAWSLGEPVREAFRRVRGLAPKASLAPHPTSSSERYGWPIRTAMIAIALAYFFVGFQKWRYSGLSWVTGDNLRWILYASSDGQAHPNGLALFVADRPLLAHVFAAGSLLLETLFPLVLFIPRLRWLFIPGVVAMHVGIRLAIGLDYSAQWLTVLIVFVNWPVVVAWARRAVVSVPAPRDAPEARLLRIDAGRELRRG
jgi:hypothetical protein